ncbi:hypothetical protein E2C01_035420 [Portunus trituberculatus]|uniref:Uncharacterized protein n=1 Tax=Portunus trituberculatus TaxID=210409 RepID=A0A5B7FBF1_PORTR|nr:hypothetical protein [Portunus trituberculatus]
MVPLHHASSSGDAAEPRDDHSLPPLPSPINTRRARQGTAGQSGKEDRDGGAEGAGGQGGTGTTGQGDREG